jgi:Tfp pilus assembly protein PilN
MQAVNLLPAYARPGHRWASAGKDLVPARVLTSGGVVAAVAAIAVGGLYFHERSVVSNRHAELADTQSRLAAAEATAAPLRAAATESSSRLAVVRTVSGSRVAWETVLHDLARVMPDGAYLTSMQVQNAIPAPAAPVVPTTGSTSETPAAPVASTGGTFTITGSTSSHVRVALVLDRLGLLPWLSSVTLSSSIRTSGGTASTTAAPDQFTITGAFTRIGGAK